ncbi:MAG: SusC/RagA family TonB-linked outer membrane protein, partial [Bacteroidota bacterium]
MHAIFSSLHGALARLSLVLLLTALLSTAWCQQALGKTPARIPLGQAIEELAKIHAVNIIYDHEVIEGSFVSDISIGSSVDQDLKRLLKGKPLTYSKLNAVTFVIKQKKERPVPKKNLSPPARPSPQLPLQVNGKVYDGNTRTPLIGASVIIVGSNRGTLTGDEGEFSLEVPVGSKLLIKYLGYEDRTLSIKKADLGVIYLTPSERNLQEVVVVGYGSQKKSDLTGALSSVGERELKELPNTGLDQALQGRAAGVYVTQNSGAPGGAVSIRIRGIGSTLTAEPLYVIDGIPVVNDNQNTSTNFAELDGGGQNTNALNTINPNDIESIEILKDASATAIYGARAANGVVLITTKRGKAGKSSITFESYYGMQELARPIPVMNLQQYADYYSEVGFEVIEEFENPELLGEGTNWQDAVFRRAGMQNYQMTLAGGTDATKYAFSVGYHQKDGTVVGSDFNRVTAKINLDHNFSSRLRVGNSFLVSRTKENITFNDNSSGVIYTALLMVPNAPVRNADGSFAGPQEEITLAFDNPVARALETNDTNTKMRVLSNLYLELEILPSLTYRTEFGTDIIYSNHNTFFPSFERGNFFGKSGVRRNLNNSLFWINKHLLTFDREFSKKHRLTTLLGFEAQEGRYEWLFASRDNLPGNELQQLTLGDAGQQISDGGAGHWALLSYFGRMNYNYDERYLLTATFRVDGSSRFGPSYRYGFFPSAAFAWRLSNEKFIQNWEALATMRPDWKFRIGVGGVGNQEIGLYSYRTNLRSLNVVLGDQLITGFAPDNIGNPDVRWESSFQTNVGANLGFYNNRIEVVADYYVKQAQGMLLPALLPSTAGSLNPPFVNIGEIENRGFELGLNTVNVDQPLFWQTRANFSINRNLVKSLGSNGNLIGLIQRIPVTRTEENQPISQFYGYQVDGIFQSQDEIGASPFQQEGTRAGDLKFKDL